MNLKDIIAIADYIKEANEFIHKNRDTIFDQAIQKKITLIDFYKATSLLSSQSRSPFWEKFFIQVLGAKKVPSTDGCGDLLWNKKYFEYKISGVNTGNLLHAVQIRIWQKVDYIIHYISKDFKSYVFVLSHAQMLSELKLLKASSAHGTKEANAKNENVEFRFTINPDSNDFIRWVKNYKINVFANEGFGN